jgi:hypothetical protein
MKPVGLPISVPGSPRALPVIARGRVARAPGLQHAPVLDGHHLDEARHHQLPVVEQRRPSVEPVSRT